LPLWRCPELGSGEQQLTRPAVTINGVTHELRIVLDPQAGGYVASCSCGWVAKRPTFYKDRAKRYAVKHEETG
jgi:hypothetical protein